MERVVIVGRGIEATHEGRTVHPQRLALALGEQVVAVSGVRIAYAAARLCVAPAHRTVAVEQPTPIHRTGRHFLKVIQCRQFLTHQFFVLQPASIAIDLHPIRVRKARLLKECRRELIDSCLRNAYLCPLASSQYRVAGITRRCSCGFLHVSLAHGAFRRLCLHVKHEAHQQLFTAVALHQRNKRHLQLAPLPLHHQPMLHFGQFRQRRIRDAAIALQVGFRHVDELRVLDFHLIDRVCIMLTHREGIGESRQHTVYPHLVGRQVEKPLGRGRHHTQHQQAEKHHPSHP